MSDGTFTEASTAAGGEPRRFARPPASAAAETSPDALATGSTKSFRTRVRSLATWATILVGFSFLVGCGALNLGKFKGLEVSGRDESYFLLKEVFLTGGSAALPRDSFDHKMHETVNLIFKPRSEKNTYVAKTVWEDPNHQEFRTIRATYDKQQEGKEGIDRGQKQATTRVHTVETAELFQHKPGIWKVSVYLDDVLARRLTFTVR
ncbi:MAG: hypothetical protein HY914_04655 [Desulfomonile tiedjei]|nr:hypothetical protein [Desulfomonile tiedjei]